MWRASAYSKQIRITWLGDESLSATHSVVAAGTNYETGETSEGIKGLTGS